MEKERCCGTCKWHINDGSGDWVCDNGRADNFSDYTGYSDGDDCDGWEEKD